MTDNEIIKALGICGNFENCKDCSLSDVGDVDKCIHTLLLNSLDLINRQKAEIDKLNKKVEELSEVLSDSIKIKAKEIKSKAIKDFAEKVKLKFYEEFDELIPSIMADEIDNLVAEMVGENNV